MRPTNVFLMIQDYIKLLHLSVTDLSHFLSAQLRVKQRGVKAELRAKTAACGGAHNGELFWWNTMRSRSIIKKNEVLRLWIKTYPENVKNPHLQVCKCSFISSNEKLIKHQNLLFGNHEIHLWIMTFVCEFWYFSVVLSRSERGPNPPLFGTTIGSGYKSVVLLQSVPVSSFYVLSITIIIYPMTFVSPPPPLACDLLTTTGLERKGSTWILSLWEN